MSCSGFGATNLSPVSSIRAIHVIHRSPCIEVAVQQHRAIWPPNQLALTYVRIQLRNQIQKKADNQQADALSRLLTGSKPVAQDGDEIAPFQLADEKNWDISSSTITSDESITFQHATTDCDSLAQNTRQSATFSHPTMLAMTKFARHTFEDFLSSQYHERFCSDIFRRINEGERLSCAYDDNGLLLRTVNATDRHYQLNKAKSENPQPWTCHRRTFWRSETLLSNQTTFYWPDIAVDCYVTVRKCAECDKNSIKLRRNVSAMKLFQATVPMESVAIGIPCEIIRTPRGHKYILVNKDQFTKLGKVISMKGIFNGEVAKIFDEHWVFNYGPPTGRISDNGFQFTSKFSRTSDTYWIPRMFSPQRTKHRKMDKPSDSIARFLPNYFRT